MKFWQKIRKILPKIMAEITGHDRYLPEIEWSENSWTHNIFRFYELIFWRRYGIRIESATSVAKHKDKFIIHYKVYTFEAACAHIETLVRKLFSEKRIKFEVVSLQFASVLPAQTPNIPWISFAIAADANNSSQAHTQNNSFSHTCTGSNRYLLLCTHVHRSPDYHLSGVTYNSVSMTSRVTNTSGLDCRIWDLVAPATGSNTVALTGTNSDTWHEDWSLSFTGCAQTGQPDNTGNASAPGVTTSVSWSITTVADNCWSVSDVPGGTTSISATAGTLVGSQSLAWGQNIFYNGPKTPAGSQTTSFTCPSQTFPYDFSFLSFSPLSVTTQVKTVTAKARILLAGIAKTVTAKARVKQPGVAKTVTSKGRIKQAGVIKTISAKGYILGTGAKTIRAKADIFQPGVIKTITAKANVVKTMVTSVTSKARIKIANIAKTITAKAHIHAPRRGFILMKNKDQTYKQSMSDNRIR